MAARPFELNIIAHHAGDGCTALLVAPSGRLVWYLHGRCRMLRRAACDGIEPAGVDIAVAADTAAGAVAKSREHLRALGWDGAAWTAADTAAAVLGLQADRDCSHVLRALVAAAAGVLHRLAGLPLERLEVPLRQLHRMIAAAAEAGLSPAGVRWLRRTAELEEITRLGLMPNGEPSDDGYGLAHGDFAVAPPRAVVRRLARAIPAPRQQAASA